MSIIRWAFNKLGAFDCREVRLKGELRLVLTWRGHTVYHLGLSAGYLEQLVNEIRLEGK